jgi:hypothetical protein
MHLFFVILFIFGIDAKYDSLLVSRVSGALIGSTFGAMSAVFMSFNEHLIYLTID